MLCGAEWVISHPPICQCHSRWNVSSNQHHKDRKLRPDSSFIYATVSMCLNLPACLRVVFSVTRYKHLSEGGGVAMETGSNQWNTWRFTTVSRDFRFLSFSINSEGECEGDTQWGKAEQMEIVKWKTVFCCLKAFIQVQQVGLLWETQTFIHTTC